MRTIQDVGLEILNKTPQSFYVFCGEEYGIKDKYINILRSCYSDYHEVSSVRGIIDTMRTKHFVPLVPALYVVRYDEDFVANVDSTTAKKIASTKIVGTIVCIYEKAASANKFDKYLPEYTVSIDKVDPKFLFKYLISDFSNLSHDVISAVVNTCKDYSRCRQICTALDALENVPELTSDNVASMFGVTQFVSDNNFRHAVASRNFRLCMDCIDEYVGDIGQLYYTILSTMLELEKVVSSKYAQSDLTDYKKQWSIVSIYNMFMQTYNLLKISRSYSLDPVNSLIYLCSLLAFKEVPEVQ